ncbi:uncharacterized protein LOC125577804 isoform X1 [Brassica napus]|uniref:uncharacterized protein LOC125577804 isoform X1 n=1 Tax=Brassica napus TaxID=3708 RepID=UPI0020791838|nr:uncharacterized protein LOC125577804 isoform X1 [Brassica napus]
MAYEFPQRILEEGIETQIDKINNTCRRTILEEVKGVLNTEYEEVLKDPVFGPLLAIIENKLIYSGKIIHSFICKQLKVSKLHELWFLFAKRPLRFSAQEFHAVTGLKFKDEPDINFNDWKDDKGFWSNVLRKNRKVNLSMIKTKLLNECNKWTYVDRVRLVYLCVIHGFLIAKDSRVFIPHEYIRLVMDFEKMRMYPWGLHAYDELLASILKARKDLHLKNSYVLDGFSYAFQIWVMEAIPDIGSMVGKKIKKNMTKVRCRNWKGSGKVSYADISSLESHFNKGELFPFISATGNNDVVDSTEFYREDEKIDERIGRIVTLLNAKQDWTDFVWEVEALPPTLELSDSETDGENVEVEDVTDTHVDEPAVVARRGKRKLNDPGAEARKKELLCQRAAEHNSGISSGMKTFIEGLFTSAFNSFKDVVQNDIQERFEKVQKEMAVWLQNQEIDAVLFLFRERTSLRRWNPSKVAFMSCIFSNQMKNSYTEFKKDKKKFRVEGLLHQYGIGELPSHGRTRLMWDLDVNRMYVPLLVHGNHWISMCVNFVTRSIEVFDCAGLKHNKDLEPFAHLIPRIVKAVQSSEKRGLTVKPYDVTYAPMPCFLNKTSSDCGVYALKHIEAHLLGMDLTCWCGKGIVTYVSKTEENPYRRFFRCEIGLKRKKEQHLFKWVDEALLDEIQMMHEQQSRMAKEIEDLRRSLKMTVEEAVIEHKKSGDVGLIGSILTFLCLCSKFD